MSNIDLNLLVALDALLIERSVTAAARRLGLSPSAMSRTLARLRQTTRDPLLVQAGRHLVATPYAEELAARVHVLTRETRAVLQPAAAALDVARLERSFVIRASEGFLDLFGASLLSNIAHEAPDVRLVFVPKPDKDAESLRDGAIDLEVGVLGTRAPEIRTHLLFRDRFVGACRIGHPLLAGTVTPERYAACRHVVVSRRGIISGPVDDALATLGLKRTVAAVVPAHPEALWIARDSDLVALVPRLCLGNDAIVDRVAILGLEVFDLPVATPGIAISAIWHPRLDGDPAHRWLRRILFDVCKAARVPDTA
ncbi:LysR family transcriptional regulator [Rhizobium jaguaris]|uniref:LysR family transcriptional regulator n=1 Tax=Rhizobium jaguaris TaxID=1312183 RepID=A0A387FTI2_9HYPH|nr:LysR family transcriptional regulator [Rhizobium jaguaris]AYG62560.1 LysR family transcriptional regulator [Rhizobium jaguaris]